jgi:inorganic triphosphatase YgiF
MTAPKELELKLVLPPASLPQLGQLPLVRKLKNKPERTNEVSVYFDTPKQKLRKHGVMLRVRHVGDRYIQTIKSDGRNGLLARNEWEADIPAPAPDLDLAAGTALAPLISRKLRAKLKPVFETRVARTVYPIVDREREIELTVDRGTIEAGERSAPLCEVELELARGEEADLFRFAREVAEAVPAQLAFRSKAERGYALIDDARDAPVKSVPIHLAPDMAARAAFQAIVRGCLKQVVDNEAALLKGEADGVHQMRVGLRRLRAAMSLFRELLDDAGTEAVKRELKWVAGALTPARELDVLKSQVLAPVKRVNARPRGSGLPDFSRVLDAEHKKAYGRARVAVTSERFRTLSLDVAAWIETGAWTKPADDLIRARGERPVEMWAAEQLDRRWKKVRKKGRALDKLDAASRHKLRIQGKKLRYAAEFFDGAFRGKRARKRHGQFTAALKDLQDCLGVLNDVTVHEDRLVAMGVRRADASRKRAFAAGLLTGREMVRYDAAIKAARKAFAELAEVKPFWR